jgi:hypothetical protein
LLADKARVRSDDHTATTWAAVGQTQVVAITGAGFAVNLVSAANVQGALRITASQGRFTANSFINICKRLLKRLRHDLPVLPSTDHALA